MVRQMKIFTFAILFLAATCSSNQADKEERVLKSFETANVHFEQNATDGDVEVVFEVKGGDHGLVRLKILSPDGRPVVDFTASDPSTMGIRQFRMESPEPSDVASLKKAYPEGAYKFTATDVKGTNFQGASTLNHTLPGTVSFLNPVADAEDVDAEGLEIKWSAVANVANYILEIEQDELNVNIIAKLPGTAKSFSVPPGFLQPDTEYTMAIGTVTKGGNASFVETSFTTAE